MKLSAYLPGASRLFLVLLFVATAAGYVWVARMTGLDSQRFVIAIVERFNIFGVDDVYRYYYARSAWVQPGLY